MADLFDHVSFTEEHLVVQPYQYEPVDEISSEFDTDRSTSDSESEDERSLDLNDSASCRNRDVSDWCMCSQCTVMPTVTEERCCKNINILDHRTENIQCITEHEGFQVNCLNIHVLETSYYEYVHDHGPLEEGQLIHEVYRYLAYRRFTRWVYGLLPKKCRRVIPSCAVTAIRRRFPSQLYCGFMYPPVN